MTENMTDSVKLTTMEIIIKKMSFGLHKLLMDF